MDLHPITERISSVVAAVLMGSFVGLFGNMLIGLTGLIDLDDWLHSSMSGGACTGLFMLGVMIYADNRHICQCLEHCTHSHQRRS
jgi:hypothetical protein